jgi:hypothetical protein
MSELVQDDAAEQGHDRAAAPVKARQAALFPALVAGIGQQQQEAEVKGYLDTPDPEQVD